MRQLVARDHHGHETDDDEVHPQADPVLRGTNGQCAVGGDEVEVKNEGRHAYGGESRDDTAGHLGGDGRDDKDQRHRRDVDFGA